ncbi:AraC family transcriptional regulator [Salmonella enterica]|nr:AraC family transcriptional regulator [Salmonella enterica]EHG4041486.1 AraC family transcriptional regulator [Salmonella enterica]EHG6848594.1 AraC family transcriptional regulator [Salmonella enterica]
MKDCLLLIDCAILTVTSGTLAYRKLQVAKLAKFLAFIDEANPESSTTTEIGHFFECVDCDNSLVFSDVSRTEEWFLAEYMMKRIAFNPLLNLLRKTESYGLVRYLLVRSLQQFSLSELGKTYGVSYSHFRRLCYCALGGKVKVELCNWRMIRVIFEIIKGSNDVTTVVYKYGYSSPSHFFAEVKSRLRNFPVCLWKKK